MILLQTLIITLAPLLILPDVSDESLKDLFFLSLTTTRFGGMAAKNRAMGRKAARALRKSSKSLPPPP